MPYAKPKEVRLLKISAGILVYLRQLFTSGRKNGELGASEVRHILQLEDENAWLKRLVADLTLDKNILQEVIKKKITGPQT